MKKIVHFSDIHIGFGDMNKRFNSIILNLAKLKQPAENYVVVITGDIVDKASDENYLMAAKYLDVLKKEGYEVLIIPGNHDYGSGDSADEKWVDIFKTRIIKNANVIYPNLNLIDEIAFIGLDSMAAEFEGWWDKKNGDGELGDDQLNELDRLLDSPEVEGCKFTVVYLHHHPWDPIPFHSLKDSEKFQDVLSNHKDDEGKAIVKALLFGHLHHGKKWNGLCGIPRVYDAGTTTMKRSGPGFHRVIDLERDPIYDYDADLHGEYANISNLPLSSTLLEFLLSHTG